MLEGNDTATDLQSHEQGLGSTPVRYDVAIVGGGPAGSAAALSLLQESPDLAVAIIESSNYAKSHPGELLAGTAQPLLEQLRLWESFLAAGYARSGALVSAWESGELSQDGVLGRSFRSGWRLQPKCFQRFLADEARKAGADLYTGVTVHHARLEGETWHLEIRKTQHGEETLPLRASFVIDATGRDACFATRRSARSVALDRLTGTFVSFTLGEDFGFRTASDPTDGPLIESCEHGWWYCSPVVGTEMTVAFFTDADLANQLHLHDAMAWTMLLEETRYIRERVRGAESQTPPEIVPVHSHRLDHMRGERWLAAGDAAASFDPLASYGFNRALCSGILAGYAVNDFLAGNRRGVEKYEGLMISEYEDHLKVRSDLYRRELQWKGSVFWRRRQADVTVHPERVVRLQQQAPNLFQLAGVHLSLRELKLLCELCSSPSPAHEVVAAFRAQRKSCAADVTVMAALQHLIDEGILSCAA